MPSIMVSIEHIFANAFGLLFATEIIIPIAAGTRHIQQATVCNFIFAGSDVALINVTSMPSIIDNAKNILCTTSFFFGMNINREVMMKENTITTSKINIALKAILSLRLNC